MKLTKKTWKGYNLLDLILILIGFIGMTISGIIFNSPWYIFINTYLGLLYVFTQAKGKVSTLFLGVVYFCFYICICFSQKYYGEGLLYLTIMLPLYIYGIIQWLSHRDKKENVVIIRKHISKKEIIIASICYVIVSIFVYILLKALKTEELIINTLSFISMLPAVYLLMRRSILNHIMFLVNDFIVPFLWILLVIKGDYSFLPMCLYHVFQISYDIYGLIEWRILEKKQENDPDLQENN